MAETHTKKKIQRALVSRRLLQASVAIGGLVPVLAGLMGIVLGPGMVENSGLSSVSMDSHYRYLSALLLGIGIGFWSCIPHIEKKRARFLLLSAIVVLGGCGRLTSLLMVGVPDQAMIFGLAMELVIVPLLVVWQIALGK